MSEKSFVGDKYCGYSTQLSVVSFAWMTSAKRIHRLVLYGNDPPIANCPVAGFSSRISIVRHCLTIISKRMQHTESIRIQADAILVSPTVIHRPGQIVIRNGRILACSADCSEQADLQLPGSLLSAGLVNAHTHLEFSDLSLPFAAGKNFPEWIGSVIRHRRTIAETHTEVELAYLRRLAFQTGYEESQQAGVAIIGDIVTRPWSPDELTAASASARPSVPATFNPLPLILRNNLTVNDCLQHLQPSAFVFSFPEIIGLDQPRFIEASQWALQLAAIENPATPVWQIGLSPHAPYSIHFPTAVNELGTDFARHQVTAMHVAESLDELEWLDSGSGPFREVFERLGVPADAPRASILEIVKWLGGRERSLLIHGNYLNEAETKVVAEEGITIVYCPRTHRHFGHSQYPLRRFIDSNINVILGTDSRASNPDLNLWNEVVALRESHPWVQPEWAYSAVTQRSAEALGIASDFGTLQAGRVASINVSHLDTTVATTDLLDELTVRKQPFTPLANMLAPLRNI